MKIVHLAQDEKFLPLARSLFEEAFPGANTFVVCRHRRKPPTFLKSGAQVRYRHPLFFRLPWLMPELRSADIIVVHAMTQAHAHALRAAPKSALVVWIGYGHDYLGLLSQHIGGFWFAKTEALLNQLSIREQQIGNLLMHIPSVAQRVNVFSVNPSESAMVREALPQLRATHHSLPSYTVEDIFAQGPPLMDGPDVLLGQSASPHNNHLEAFDLLRDHLPTSARLIVPLSYVSKRYADHIEQVGRTLFGERFIALRDWMPLAEYQQQIARCGFVVMNHRVQMAVGNIVSALYKGAKVFMQPANPLFGFFTDLGVTVFDIGELSNAPATAWQPLPTELQQRNRAAMVGRYGRAQVVSRIAALEHFWQEHRLRC